MQRLCALLGPHAEVVADFSASTEELRSAAGDDEVLSMLRRRPCRAPDVAAGLSIPLNDALKRLGDLSRRGLLRERIGRQGHYYEVVRSSDAPAGS
jgi:hypothetical protein